MHVLKSLLLAIYPLHYQITLVPAHLHQTANLTLEASSSNKILIILTAKLILYLLRIYRFSSSGKMLFYCIFEN